MVDKHCERCQIEARGARPPLMMAHTHTVISVNHLIEYGLVICVAVALAALAIYLIASVSNGG